MSSIIVSPNMNLPVPITGQESGPQYATDINNCMSVIDGHTHTAGSGVPITPLALNINADLSFISNNATLLRSVRFSPQSAALALPADIGCLYEAGDDLYYNDGAGNQIRMTQSGSISGAAGTITGLPSGTASASYAASTFTFQSATNTSANIDGQSFILRNNLVSSKGLTLSPPNAMASDYALTLPSLPAQTNVVSLDTAGNFSTITYDQVGQGMTSVGANAIGLSMTSTGANSVANARTRGQGSSVGIGGVASSGQVSFTTSSLSFVDVTSLTVTIVSTGKPIFVGLVGAGGPTNAGYLSAGLNSASTAIFATYALAVNGSATAYFGLSFSAPTSSTSWSIVSPPSSISYIDFQPAGTYTYKLQAKATSPSYANVNQVIMIAYEL